MYNTAHISFAGVPEPKRSPVASSIKAAPTVLRPVARESGEQMDAFIAWGLTRADLDPSVYRAISLNRRLPACLRRLRAGSVGEARSLLERRPDLLPSILDTLLLGVSEFFRDAQVFEELRVSILPEMLRGNETVRIMSIGVSEGHELYSLAMLLAEAGALDRCELLGIDCRPDAIVRARAGEFSDKDVAAIPIALRDRYFRRTCPGWVAASRLREKLQWKVADLLNLDGGSHYDIIFFRNLALYLTQPNAVRAWSLLSGQLRPNGLLVCGKADKPPAFLPLMRVSTCIYRKTGSRQ